MLEEAELTAAQLMWIDVIHGTVNQPRFSIRHGDMGYVLSNMLAKMVSSSAYYRISVGAEPLLAEFGLKPSEPVHIAKYFYGKKRDTMLEHMIPVSVLRRELLASNRSHDSVIHLACNAGVTTIMHREEDARLTKAGLSRTMPKNWTGIGDDPLKRYRAAGIVLGDLRIRPTGPICR